MTPASTEFRYFGLDNIAKALIANACAGAPWIELAPLDKGLSGSMVLMARWTVSHTPSKFHVFKIGDPVKLKREHDAINNVASPLVQHFPHASLYISDDGSRALLSQEFLGEGDGSTRSLRQYIEKAISDSDVVEIIRRLYEEQLIDWRPKPLATTRREAVTVRQALDPWIRKGDLAKMRQELGPAALESVLKDEYSLGFEELQTLVEHILESPLVIDTGPVHGDLHSQNILVGLDLKISLIDFGWTAVRWRAIDYLWLECSLKFVVASPYANVKDLRLVEQLLDDAWISGTPVRTEELHDRLLFGSLTKLAKGVDTIRELARKHLPELTLSDYRKGLIAMAYGLTTFPELNLVYLMHSIARNAQALEPELVREGPYHRLYSSRNLLWPGRPGRMVRRAAETHTTPGLALDIGCGDGKDVTFLEDRGWTVTGLDICSLAIQALQRRHNDFFGSSVPMRSSVVRSDAATYAYPRAHYDLVIAYGLYHCLDDSAVQEVHAGAVAALKPGGLFAFAAFNDRLPLPPDHMTGRIFLRPAEHIFEMVNGELEVVAHEVGEITEDHLPLVGEHRHSLTWALFRKRTA